MNLKDILSIANKKIEAITSSKRDLGIHKHLMPCLLFQQWSWERDGDWEEDRKLSAEKSGHSRANDGKDATRHWSNADRKCSKRSRNASKDETWDPKRCKRGRNNGDDQPAGPSAVSGPTADADPLHMTQTEFELTAHQENHRPADNDKARDLDWIFDEMSVSSLLAAI